MFGGVRYVIGFARIAGHVAVHMVIRRQRNLAFVIEFVGQPRPTEAKYHQVRQKNDEHEQRGLAENGC